MKATNAFMETVETLHPNAFVLWGGEEARAEIAAAESKIKAARRAIDDLEWEPVTGECLMGCGGDSADGHNEGCAFVGILKHYGLMAE